MATPKKTETKTPPKSLRKGPLPRPVEEVWAAGLGALAQAQSKGAESFDALVALGNTVLDKGGDAARTAAGQVEGAASTLAGTARGVVGEAAEAVTGGVEAVVEAALSRLGVPGRNEVLALRAQVDRLQARLEELGAGAAEDLGAAADLVVYSVVKRDDGWAVLKAGNERATSVHPTKREAERSARQTARAQAPSRLVIHKADGAVAEALTYEP